MRILLLGYGRMGRAVEEIALRRGHTVAARADTPHERDALPARVADVAIEFTQPGSAYENLRYCLEHDLPVVSGTTGWLERRPEIEQLCAQHGGAFFYASNFSVGVHLFFQLNRVLARLMNAHEQYEVSLTETHHRHKKDAPSGTAVTLAADIMHAMPRKKRWTLDPTDDPAALVITSHREGEVAGLHRVQYGSAADTLTIRHEAHGREGFASGAVLAAEWLRGRQGVFGMEDMLR